MRVLVLGGTRFLGRAFVEAALARGHALTLFNRGRTNPRLHAGVERITGDRDGGLAALSGRTWDAVMDPSGFFPRIVGASARALAGSAARYLFVSSISVHAEPMPRGVRSKCFQTSAVSLSSLTLPVPKLSTITLTGSATPIAYATCTSQRSANPAATTFLAT